MQILVFFEKVSLEFAYLPYFSTVHKIAKKQF